MITIGNRIIPKTIVKNVDKIVKINFPMINYLRFNLSFFVPKTKHFLVPYKKTLFRFSFLNRYFVIRIGSTKNNSIGKNIIPEIIKISGKKNINTNSAKSSTNTSILVFELRCFNKIYFS